MAKTLMHSPLAVSYYNCQDGGHREGPHVYCHLRPRTSAAAPPLFFAGSVFSTNAHAERVRLSLPMHSSLPALFRSPYSQSILVDSGKSTTTGRLLFELG
eukprot:3209486-Pleurochrysis_carterae.AAC.1